MIRTVIKSSRPWRLLPLVSRFSSVGRVAPKVAASMTVSTTIQRIQRKSYATLPSHRVLDLPALSPTMETGNVVSWSKKPGDKIEVGDVLVEIETDKAQMAFEAQDDGYLAKILIPAGTKDVAVGKPIAIVVDDVKDVAAFANYSGASSSAPSPAASTPAPAPAASAPAATSSKSYPSHVIVNLPALSPTMETGNVGAWNKKPGDKIEVGDVLVEIETDKAQMGFEAQDEGYLAKILVNTGTKDFPVGQPIAVVVEDPKDVPAFADFVFGAPSAPSSQPTAQAATPPTATPSKPSKSYPPHVVLDLPALSPTMETGNIGQWRKKVGEKVNAGDALVEIETDKAQMDFECQEEGYLAKILYDTGAKDVKVGVPLAVLVQDEALVKDFADFSVEAPKVASAPTPAAAPVAATPKKESTTTAPSGHVDLHAPGMPRLPPSVYKLCAENNIDPRQLTPSGKSPTGKPFYRKGDVLQYLEDVKSGKIKPTVVTAAPVKQKGEAVAMEVEINLAKLQQLRDALTEKLKIQFQDVDLQTKAATLAMQKVTSAPINVSVDGQIIPSADRYRLSDVAKWIGSFQAGHRSAGDATLNIVTTGSSKGGPTLTLKAGKTVPVKKQEEGIKWGANPVGELLGPLSRQVPNFGPRLVGDTAADKQLEKAVSILLGGKMPASAPQLDMRDLLGLDKGTLPKTSTTVKAGLDGLDKDSAKVFLSTFKKICENPEQLIL